MTSIFTGDINKHALLSLQNKCKCEVFHYDWLNITESVALSALSLYSSFINNMSFWNMNVKESTMHAKISINLFHKSVIMTSHIHFHFER